jgi:hypothetical protein
MDPDTCFRTFCQLLDVPTWGYDERYHAIDALAQLLRALCLEGVKPAPVPKTEALPAYLAGYRQARRDIIARCKVRGYRHVATLAKELEREERHANG